MCHGTSDFPGIVDLLKNADQAYALKKKRLRHIRSALAGGDLRRLCSAIDAIWVPREGGFSIRDPAINRKGLEILRGLCGGRDDEDHFIAAERAIAALDPGSFQLFLGEKIGNVRAAEHLYSLMCGGNASIVELARRQVQFLKEYIPIVRKLDAGSLETTVLTGNDVDAIKRISAEVENFADILASDIALYRAFMRDFALLYRERTRVDIVGYGEISTVMRLRKMSWSAKSEQIINDDNRWIWKKMPPFPSREEVDRYEKLYGDYREVLTERIGINVPPQVLRRFPHGAWYIVYAGQEKLDARCVGNNLVKVLDAKNAVVFLKMILGKIHDVHRFNASSSRVMVGIDAQLSNWVLDSRSGTSDRVDAGDGLWYIDTSSPMMRIDGEEQINTDIFIKSAASFLRPVIRAFFLQEVLDRYYDTRSVVIDIIANLHKEKRVDLIDTFIETANAFFSDAGITDRALTRKEIDRYYSGDAFIWRFYQASRKIDRFITETILRKKYQFRIPETIVR